MNALYRRLEPLAPRWLGLRLEGDALVLCGLEGAPPDLPDRLAAEWPALCREEALALVRQGLAAESERLRPPDFADLAAKAALGRLAPGERGRLQAYYDALAALEARAAELEAFAAAADVAALNAHPWPAWVAWAPLPAAPRLVLAEPQPPAPREGRNA